MIMYNDIWHIKNEGINRFYFAANGPTYTSGGSATSTDNCFIVYSSGATGYATNLSILNNGNVGIGNINNSASKLHVNGTTFFQGYCVIGGNLLINGSCSPYMTSVANSGTDYVGVQINSSRGSAYQYPLCIMFGSFTGFHRCFVDDELFDINNIIFFLPSGHIFPILRVFSQFA
jgi:hypothetical protein